MLLSRTLHAVAASRAASAAAVPSWQWSSAFSGRWKSVVVPMSCRSGAGYPRTILVVLVLRRGHTVTSDFLVDVLWGDELPRNPANALQIQVSYLRKTLGAADPSGSAVLETQAGGYALVVDPEQIDAHRFEVASRSFAPLKALRSEAELLDALDETERALALWRGDALEDVAGLEFARGEIARLDELRWAATERWVDWSSGSAATATRSACSPSWSARCRCESDCTSSSCSPSTGLAARPKPCAPMGTPGGRWSRSSASSRARNCATSSDASSNRTHRWTGHQPTTRHLPPIVEPSPPGRATSGRLPVPVSALVGRDQQITRLEHLVERHRALTLTGPAGAGKTRLAIEVAARNHRHVCYVDFSPIDDPALVAPTVAAAAGVTIAPGDDPVAAIAEALASREVLVVLDTCEHVVGAAAQLASAALRTAPGVRVLATSRRPLGVSGEFAWPVPPLDLPPPDAVGADDITSHAAVALFVERATAVSPDLEVDDTVAADIAAVCIALDGLPLAIELAAARTDVLSPAAVRSRLEDRFGLLVDGGTMSPRGSRRCALPSTGASSCCRPRSGRSSPASARSPAPSASMPR